jgi:tRNA-specific 2-thiouridylase
MSATRVLAAMSGGVDSGVAAALLAERGCEVTGVTLKLWCYGSSPIAERACCTIEAIEDARRVAARMGFTHWVVEAEDVFRARVLQPFLDDYAAGRTPYPCALCNQHLKFGDLVARMELVGADLLCTGHYARVRRLADGDWGLFRARDPAKDQSYALALIPHGVLPRVAFPLGDLTKAEARAHAARLGLSVWDKPESMDLCFVPDGDYAGAMVGRLGETRGTAPGPVVDTAGREVGTHRGVIHYTVGQRRGLGIAASERLYVIGVDAGRNSVTVGPRAALESPGFVTGPMNWLVATPPAAGTRVHARIRAHHEPAPASVEALPDGRARVTFESPQLAVTPGQLGVLYDGDRVLGGAAIERALPARGVQGAGLAAPDVAVPA